MTIDQGKDKDTADPETTQAEQRDAAGIWGGGCLPGPGMPSPFPPKPSMPAMTIAFKFGIGEPVQISHNRLRGSIIAAAVTFNETTNLYLVDVGVADGKWYPENMLKPLLVYHTMGGGGGEETGNTPAKE